MKINLSGHHVEVSDSIREHIEEKFSKLATHFPTLIALDTIISLEHGKHHVELSTNYEGVTVSVSSTNAVMFPAIATTPDIAHEKIQ